MSLNLSLLLMSNIFLCNYLQPSCVCSCFVATDLNITKTRAFQPLPKPREAYRQYIPVCVHYDFQLFYYSFLVHQCDLSWDQIVPSLRLMQSKLIDLGFEYHNGNIVINETETEGSQYHA